MNPYDERTRAEQLDLVLDGQGEPEALSPEEVTTVRLLMSLAAAMEPDPAFVARLEQRLRAMDGRLAGHIAGGHALRTASTPKESIMGNPIAAEHSGAHPLHPAWRALRAVASLGALALLTLLLILLLSPRGAGLGGDGDNVGTAAPTLPGATATLASAAALPTTTAAPTETVAPTMSAAPAAELLLTLCPASEPTSLLPTESAYITELIREIIQPAPIAVQGYEEVPVLVEALPSEAAGTLDVESVTLMEGDRFFDSEGFRTLTLTAGMTETFTLAQPDGSLVVHKGWQGEPLEVVRVTARWTLVEGLMWEDGEPVGANDLAFAFELDGRLRDPAMAPALIGATARAVALDERTFEWEGLPGFAEPPASGLPRPQPRHAYADLAADDDALLRAPLAYGPYRLDEWVAGEGMTLAPNLHARGGPPPLDELRVRFLPQRDLVLPALLEGSCDVATLDFGWEGMIPILNEWEEKGEVVVYRRPTTVFEHISFNLLPAEEYTGASATLRAADGSPLFQSADFRRAVAHCLDREALIEEALGGAAFPAESYLPEGHPLFPAEGLPETPFDPAAGRALLAALGAEDRDGDGTAEDAVGTPLILRYDTRENPTREGVAAVVASQLQENCAIALDVGMHGSEFFAARPDGIAFGRRFDLAAFAWFTGIAPACDLYTSAAIPGPENGWTGRNLTGFRDPEFDAACAADDPAAQGEAARRFAEALPAIPLYSQAAITVARPEVRGLAPDPSATVETWNVAEWRVDGER